MPILPPFQDCLLQYIKRANYQVAIWKREDIVKPDLPDSTNGCGWTTRDSIMEPLWKEGKILPLQLASILEEVVDEESDKEYVEFY